MAAVNFIWFYMKCFHWTEETLQHSVTRRARWRRCRLRYWEHYRHLYICPSCRVWSRVSGILNDMYSSLSFVDVCINRFLVTLFILLNPVSVKQLMFSLMFSRLYNALSYNTVSDIWVDFFSCFSLMMMLSWIKTKIGQQY